MVICDSTPLIGLSRVKRLDILHSVYPTIVIPGAVFDEVCVQGHGLPGSQEVRDADWIDTRFVQFPVITEFWSDVMDLDAGESEVLALAAECVDPLLVIDDEEGRVYADTLGYRTTRTIDVVMDAERRGLISSGCHVIAQMIQSGFMVAEASFDHYCLGYTPDPWERT